MEEAFIVKIKRNQHATWQGSVDWISRDGKTQSQYFRSALELISLLDSTMDKADCRSWGEVSATCI